MTPTLHSRPPARAIVQGIARFTWKAIQFFSKILLAASLTAISLVLLLPPAAFAWRSSQPMNDPVFNGLSFYQVVQFRDRQYQVSVAGYNEAHPDSRYPIPPEVCSWIEVADSLSVSALLAGVCTLAKCSGLVVVPTRLETYPTAIWTNFEANLIDQFDRAAQQPAAACRLRTSFP
jgi:hypothetical protein